MHDTALGQAVWPVLDLGEASDKYSLSGSREFDCQVETSGHPHGVMKHLSRDGKEAAEYAYLVFQGEVYTGDRLKLLQN